MVPPWGPHSNMLPCLFFMSCQTRTVTLVTPMPSVWFEVVEIAVPVITDELGSPASMAPPPLHYEPAGGNAPLSSVPSALPRTARIRYPSGVKWPVHRGHGAQHPRHWFTTHGGAPHQPACTTSCPVSGDAVKPRSAERTLRFSPSVFPKSTRSPTSVQKYFFSVLFSSVLAPVLLKNSARRPDHVRV